MTTTLVVQLETSDHGGGYCSGAICVYTCLAQLVEVPTPDGLKASLMPGTKLIDPLELRPFLAVVEGMAERGELDFLPTLSAGSACCRPSPESLANNLGVHDYRLRVLSAKINGRTF